MRKAVVILTLVMMVCGGAWAFGKVTVDPNASDQAVIEQWENDTRLSQKVTYEARHKAVKVILEDLSDMMGVTLNAGFNKQDWQVRDRKMNIFAKDITLADLLNSIARTMKFKWSINKDVIPWTYRLFMDRKTLAVANAELSKAQKDFDEQITRRRADYADMIDNWSDDLSASDLDQLKQDNPYLYMLHAHGIGVAIKGLFNDVPGLKENFINKEMDMAYPISSLSAETQAYVIEAAKMKYQEKGQFYAGNGEPLPESVEKAILGGTMWFDFVPDELGWASYEFRKYGGIGLHTANGGYLQVEPFLSDPDNPVTKQIAKEETYAYENQTPFVLSPDDTQLQQASFEESKMLEEFFPTEPQPTVNDGPDLHKKIKVKPENKDKNRLTDVEAALAQASGFAVVSDSFRSTSGFAAISESETELQDVLNTIGEGFRYNWNKHGSIIELNSKEWFKRRTTQIPDEWLEQWHADMKELGYMSIDDYAQIAMLTTPQIEENIKTDDDFRSLNIFRPSYSKDIWLLRLYATLSVSQKKELLSETGLSSLSFSSDQWYLLRKTYESSSIANSEDSMLFKCTASTNGNEKMPFYNFQLIDTKTNETLNGFPIWTIKYVEQPKPEQQKTEEKKN